MPYIHPHYPLYIYITHIISPLLYTPQFTHISPPTFSAHATNHTYHTTSSTYKICSHISEQTSVTPQIHTSHTLMNYTGHNISTFITPHVLTYLTTHSCHKQCIHNTSLNINNVKPATSHYYIHTQYTPHKSHTSQSFTPIKQHINISPPMPHRTSLTYHILHHTPIHSTCAPHSNTIA